MELIGVSVIVPCYNTGNRILETVNSVLKAIHDLPFEIIICDDDSTCTRTKESLRELEKQTLPLTIIQHRKNLGVQESRNTALRKAKFKYIIPLDGDDCLIRHSETSYPFEAVNYLESNDDLAFIHSYSQMFGDFDGLTISSYPLNEEMVAKKHHVPTSIVYRKVDGLGCGGYDSEIKKWQDWSFGVALLNYRVRENKMNIIRCIPKPSHHYRIHGAKNRISSSKISEREMTKLTVLKYPELFRKYYGSSKLNSIADLVFQQKPTKLDDLLSVAASNLEYAIEIAYQRKYSLDLSNEKYNIP